MGRTGFAVVVVILTIGITGQLAGPATSAQFSDAHDGTANVSADSRFGPGGPGGGPQADAGGPYTVQEGESIYYLNGLGSTGNIDEYHWSIISGPGGGQYWPDFGLARFDAPANVDGTTQTIVQLQVIGNNGRTRTDTAVITITDSNTNAASTAGVRSGVAVGDDRYTIPENSTSLRFGNGTTP